MYSGLAEAYGVYIVLSFLLQYCHYHPMEILATHLIHVYCNNSRVLDWINHKSNQPWCPLWWLPDLCWTSVCHHATQSHLSHFPSCQRPPRWKIWLTLTIPEKLNIDCNAQEWKLAPHMHVSTLQHNPTNQARYPHLQIAQQVITKQLQDELCDAFT